MTDKLLEAVDDLAVELGIGPNGLAFTWNQLEALNVVLAAHAHELAAKIREPLTHAETLEIQAHVPLRELLARRIDPEVTS